MSYYYPSYDTLKAFCGRAFTAFGFSREESEIIGDVLLKADLYGIESHGMQRMARYHKGIEKGLIHPEAKPLLVFETPVSGVMDAQAGMGQLAAHRAMSLAIEKAKKSGIGIVTVRNSNHYGIAGYYAEMASREGLIGFSCTNSEAIMVPTNARLAMLGSNPIACAVPADPTPFLFDASTTVVTRGKLEIYNKAGKKLPKGWALNEEGEPTEDAALVLGNIIGKKGGGIMPLGGFSEELGSHKGYGFAMICELFSSILSLGKTSPECMTRGRGEICHGFAAIDPACFGDPAAIKAHFSDFLKSLREAPLAGSASRIYTHGEKEKEAVAERLKEGIPVNENTLGELWELCEYLKLPFKEYFPDYEPAESRKASFY